MSHTPGPWKVSVVWSQQTGDTYSVEPYVSEEQMKINAPVIEAAPDLLEALHGLLLRYVSLAGSGDCVFWDPEEEEQVKVARAAIAKAEGRS